MIIQNDSSRLSMRRKNTGRLTWISGPEAAPSATLLVLHDVAVAAARANDEDDLIERVTQLLSERLYSHHCGLWLVDTAANALRAHPTYWGLSERIKQTPIPLGLGVTGTVAVRGCLWRLPDVWREPTYIPADPNTRSELCVPLKVGDQVLGVLNVESPELNAFGQNDECLLVIVATQLALALDRLRAEAEQRLRDAETQHLGERTAQLWAANQALEAFASCVAHELRAPLRSLDGYSRLLLEDYAKVLDTTGQHHLGRIRAISVHMRQLIDDLLQFARLTCAELRLESVDLPALAEAVLSELQHLEPHRRVRLILPDRLTVRGDARLLRLALQNLLTNAWKFTRLRAPARIELGARTETGTTVYYVRDNGAGFDMAYVDKLFGAFQRLHTMHEYEGVGIGLLLVQRIIERHGGRVWAEGAVDQGATFYFTLG